MDMVLMSMGSPQLTGQGDTEEQGDALEGRFAMVMNGLMSDQETAETSAQALLAASLNEVQGLR